MLVSLRVRVWVLAKLLKAWPLAILQVALWATLPRWFFPFVLPFSLAALRVAAPSNAVAASLNVFQCEIYGSCITSLWISCENARRKMLSFKKVVFLSWKYWFDQSFLSKNVFLKALPPYPITYSTLTNNLSANADKLFASMKWKLKAHAVMELWIDGQKTR